MTDSSDEGEQEYEVERLLAEDIVEGQVFYLVKWVGYPDEQCTWEPLESFNSNQTIGEWEKAKSDGDVLDDEFLTALQQRMDDFQGRRAPSASKDDHVDNAGDSDDEAIFVPLSDSDLAGQASNVASDNDSIDLSVRIKKSGSPVPKKRKLFHRTLGESSARVATVKPTIDILPAIKPPLPDFQRKNGPQRTTPRTQPSPSQRIQASNTRNPPKVLTPKTAPGKTEKSSNLKIKGPSIPNVNRVGLSGSGIPSLTDPARPKTTSNKGTINPDRSEELRPLAGQRFRNLKHQNNARKKSRIEPAPDLSALKLIAAAELDVGNTEDTAHLLPLGTTVVNRDVSSLFIPESANDAHAQAASHDSTAPRKDPQPLRVGRQDGPSVVPPPATGQDDTTGQQSSNKMVKEPKPSLARFEAPPGVNPITDKPRPFDSNSHGDPMPRHSNQGFPPAAKIVRSPNGLEWYKGDLVVDLSLGKPIGVVKFVGAPWYPIGNEMVSLKVGNNLKIDFPADSVFTRYEYNLAQPHHNGAIWSVEAFPHTVQAVDEFSKYLEQNDIAGLWHHPRDNLSMLLYSSEAKSWRDIGWQPARIGRPRLHVAFIRNLNKRVNKPSTVSTTLPQAVPVTISHNTLVSPRTQAREVEPSIESTSRPVSRRSLSRDRSASRDPRSRRNSGYSSRDQRPPNGASSVETTFRSPSEYQSTPISPRTPTAPPDGAMSIRRDVNYDLRLQALKAELTIPDLSIDFKSLTDRSVSNPKIDKKRAYFFIAFSKSHEHEATVLHRWLEIRAAPNHVFTDSDQDGWDRLKVRANHQQMVAIIFHAESPDYHRFDGLGDILSLEYVQCLSLSFGPYSATGVTPVAVSTLFPRGSVFLVTETNIRRSIDHTTFILRYFLKEARPGWKIMFRPRIRAFLRDAALKESNPINRVKLLDLLVYIQKMVFAVDPEPHNSIIDDENEESLRGGESGGEDKVKAYVVSPSSLPHYDDTGQDAESLKKRDGILLEYFCGWTADRASKYRRFWAFGKGLVVADSGHIHFEDHDRFVERNTKKVLDVTAK